MITRAITASPRVSNTSNSKKYSPNFQKNVLPPSFANACKTGDVDVMNQLGVGAKKCFFSKAGVAQIEEIAKDPTTKMTRTFIGVCKVWGANINEAELLRRLPV